MSEKGIKNKYILIFMLTISFAIIFSINSISFGANQIITTTSGNVVAQNVDYSNVDISNMRNVSFEQLSSTPYLFCIEHGVALPAELSASSPLKDATVQHKNINQLVTELTETNKRLGEVEVNGANVSNPYGTTNSVVTKSNTISQYEVSNPTELTPAAAYVQSHTKSTNTYPDAVQSATWETYGRTITSDDLTMSEQFTESLENAAGGRDLAKEAEIFAATYEQYNTFKNTNKNTIYDVTDYNNIKIAYNKNSDKILVGPFRIDYVRGMYAPSTYSVSTLKDENGIVSFAGITNAKLYADDSKTVEVNDWKFIFPDKDATGRRTALALGDDYYAFPYPQESFYIELSNSANASIDVLSRFVFETEYLSAEGESYELTGTYDQIDWIARDEIKVCRCSVGKCVHGSTTPHMMGLFMTCALQIYCSEHPQHRLNDGHAAGHTFFIEANVAKAGVHSQKLEVLSQAQVIKNNEVVEVELGAVATPAVAFPFLAIPFWVPYKDDCTEYVPYLPPIPVDPNEPEPEDPEPGDPEEPEIKLTFDIEGDVWVDNLSGKESEANGIKDAGEKTLANIIVSLYKKGETEPIAQTLTDAEGHYEFKYIRIGYEYYVDFIYDGVTYETTKYLGSQLTEYNNDPVDSINAGYKSNPENYLTYSHAIENAIERDEFNAKFDVISNNMATGNGVTTELNYLTQISPQGAKSSLITVNEDTVVYEAFQMHASTATTNLYFPLNDKIIADEEDLSLVQVGEEYYYVAAYPGTKHVNLGLVKRDQGDFAVKNDVYQTIVTTKNQTYPYIYDDKTTNIATYDAHTRTPGYYTQDVYVQKIDETDYNWRYDSTYGEQTELVKNAISVEDELEVYIEYKFTIRNQSAVQWGQVLELTDYIDENLSYSDSYVFTDTTSWIETNMIDSEGEVVKQPIKWYEVGQIGGYKKLVTSDIQNQVLVSGQNLEIHLILKVEKDAGRNIYMDLTDGSYKENVLEISKYSFNEGLIDRDSNPGSAILDDVTTYEDDTDVAPLVKLVFNDYAENNGEGRIISGYVWEDLSDHILSNNVYTGNGIKDSNEKGIDNVKIELIEVLMDKTTNKEIEIIRDSKIYTTRTNSNGEYKFTNLGTGSYKVKFTYGDEEQLTKDVTYNGHDYKSISTDTQIQQYENPSMEVMILVDSSDSMRENNKGANVDTAVEKLIEKLYENVQTIKVGGMLFSEPKGSSNVSCELTTKPSKENVISTLTSGAQNVGTNLESAAKSAISKYSSDADTRVLLICTDGYISSPARSVLEEAERAGITVISVLTSLDEWTYNIFGNEEVTAAGKLYRISNVNLIPYMSEIVLEDILLDVQTVLPNMVNGKDIQKEYQVSSESQIGEIYTRENNINYSTQMVYDNAKILDAENTSDISELARRTKMTAITPVRNVLIEHDNSRTANINLGLIERPKVDLELQQKISRMKVVLSNGDILIDTAKDLSQNVQLFPNLKYIIYLDQEIMQGATLFVEYKLTVVNNSQVDTLGEYFDYDMYNSKEVEKYTSAVPTMVGTLYNYYTNLTFRPEDNSNWQIDVNNVKTDVESNASGVLTNWESYINSGKVKTAAIEEITSQTTENGLTKVLNEKVTWELKSLIATAAFDDDRMKNSVVKVAQTNSLKDLELYPTFSKNVLKDSQLTSVSTYIQFSKTISVNDLTDTLTFKNSTEIVERLNDLGRRDYIGVTGNYIPHAEITEYDSAKTEDILILNPLGKTISTSQNVVTYYIVAIISLIIVTGGIVFIKRRVLE